MKLIILFFFIQFNLFAGSIVHHEIDLKIEPAKGLIIVSDVFGDNENPNEIIIPKEASKIKLFHGKKRIPFNQRKSGNGTIILPRYSNKTKLELKISYEFKPNTKQTDIAPGVPAVVSPIGIYLSPSSVWYPYIKTDFETILLKITQPAGWTAITSGNQVKKIDNTQYSIQEIEINKPIDRLFLISNNFDVKKEDYRGISLETYFHQDIKVHSETYLKKLKEYVDLYLGYFGSYPYEKFAVVSNFFSTGYGMPGFTLLDKNIIPFPFIINSSLGHEFVHNWWGNGVYTDWSNGNWNEGLTTYQSDYLYKELESEEAAKGYRLEVLREYNNYVSKDEAFAIKDFRSRYDRISKSIGYGKVMMVFYMLERKLGTVLFDMAIKEVIGNGMFQIISWDDFERVFSKVSGIDLKVFFDQWINSKEIINLETRLIKNKLEINQNGKDIFVFDLDVELEIDHKISKNLSIEVSKRNIIFNLEKYGPITNIKIDPQFHLMRTITNLENPPSLNKFWSKKSNHYFTNIEGRKFKGLIKNFPDEINEIVEIDDYNKIKGNSFTALVNSNIQFDPIESPLYGFNLNQKTLEFEERDYDLKSHVIVLNFSKKDNEYVLVIAPTEQSLSNVVSRLSHYGKYGILIFDLNGRRILTKSF